MESSGSGELSGTSMAENPATTMPSAMSRTPSGRTPRRMAMRPEGTVSDMGILFGWYEAGLFGDAEESGGRSARIRVDRLSACSVQCEGVALCQICGSADDDGGARIGDHGELVGHLGADEHAREVVVDFFGTQTSVQGPGSGRED